MKITIVQGAFLPIPPIQGGAIEKAWFSMAQEFSNSGHKVHYISKHFADLKKHEFANGIYHSRVTGYQSPKNILQLKILDLFYSLRAFKKIPPSDVIVTHTFWMPLLLKIKNKGALYVHVGRFPKGQMKFYKHADRLQAPSRSIAKAIENEIPELKKKICNLPYPITLPSYNREYKNRSKTILYCGRIHQEKGIQILIDAIRLLPKNLLEDWNIKIVGASKVSLGGSGLVFKKELAMNSADLPIQWMDPIYDTKQLNKIYQDARIFTYPSLAERGETFGLAPLEAMSNGCIPIVSGLECFDDFISDRKNGFRFNHREKDATQSLATTLSLLIRSELKEQIEYHLEAIKTSNRFQVKTMSKRFIQDFQTLVH